jgi:hypothetical protein
VLFSPKEQFVQKDALNLGSKFEYFLTNLLNHIGLWHLTEIMLLYNSQIAKCSFNPQIVWTKQKTIEKKSLSLWNK